MSIAKLIALSQTPIDYNDPGVKARFAEVRRRMEQYDKELEARVRAKIPTKEQLNKVVNWGTLHG